MKIIDYEGNGSTLLYFNDFTSLANMTVPAVNMDEWRETLKEGKDDPRHSQSWLGVKGGHAKLREVVELYGWPEGVKRGMEAIGEMTAPKLPSIRRKRCRGSQGMSLDITRMYSGQLDKAWATTRKEKTDALSAKKSTVNVVIDITASGGVGAQAYFWRGALGCILADALTRSGRNVRVLAVSSSHGFNGSGKKQSGDKNLTIVTQVKDFGQLIDYNNMFAVCSLAGFFRHYCFKAMYSMPYRLSWGLGRPDSVNINRLDPILDDNPCILVENIWNRGTAQKKAKNLLKELEQ